MCYSFASSSSSSAIVVNSFFPSVSHCFIEGLLSKKKLFFANVVGTAMTKRQSVSHSRGCRFDSWFWDCQDIQQLGIEVKALTKSEEEF